MLVPFLRLPVASARQELSLVSVHRIAIFVQRGHFRGTERLNAQCARKVSVTPLSARPLAALFVLQGTTFKTRPASFVPAGLTLSAPRQPARCAPLGTLQPPEPPCALLADPGRFPSSELIAAQLARLGPTRAR